jgi:mRNA-degrading endonuclease RelE of RelBE toxin-antitoxin system
MSYRLFIDSEVLDFAFSLSKAHQRRLFHEFSAIKKYPHNCSDFVVQDKLGRALQVDLFGDYQIRYWIDDADQHIKILALAENE